MNITTLQEPPFEPVTLAEVYRVLRVDPEGSPAVHPLDDDFLRQITVAREGVELDTRRSLIQQTLRVSAAGFPADTGEPVRLFRPPIISVSAVTYFDAANAVQAVDPGSYYLTDEQVPELRFSADFVAPVTYDRPDAVRVTYSAGYIGDGSPPGTQAEFAANVPTSLKEAILVGVQLLQTSVSPGDFELLTRSRRALLHPFIVMLAI